MATKLVLYNDALLALGQEPLVALSESGTARNALDGQYDKALSYCLEQGFWNFAMRSVELASTPSIQPAFGYTYAVEKPEDWVRSHSFSASDTFNQPLLELNDENGVWYVNIDPLFARYVSKSTSYGLDLSLWTETFADYVALRLAVKTCKRITGSFPDADLLRAEKRALANAQSKDAMNEPPAFPPQGSWVRSRNLGSVNGTRSDRRS